MNLTPCVPLGSEVPNRKWSGKDISYSHLRVFGCKAFVHVPKDESSKNDAKTKACVFLGYGQNEFGYKLYDPAKKKLIRSRDVVFVEDQTIADIEKIDEPESKHSDNLIDLSLTSLTQTSTQIEDEVQNEQFFDTDESSE